MPIHTIPMHTLNCDDCSETFKTDDGSAMFSDPQWLAIAARQRGWVVVEVSWRFPTETERVACPDCTTKRLAADEAAEGATAS